jgi:hypothetical protein
MNVYYGSGFSNGAPPPSHLPSHTSIDVSLGKSFGKRLTASIAVSNLAVSFPRRWEWNVCGGIHAVAQKSTMPIAFRTNCRTQKIKRFRFVALPEFIRAVLLWPASAPTYVPLPKSTSAVHHELSIHMPHAGPMAERYLTFQ